MSNRWATLSPENALALSIAHDFQRASARHSGPAAAELIHWARLLSPIYQAETDIDLRRRLGALLTQLYYSFENALRRAPLGVDGLPEVAGVIWTSGSALAGTPEDVFPFGQLDLWVDHNAPRRPRRRRIQRPPESRDPPRPRPWWLSIPPPREQFPPDTQASIPIPFPDEQLWDMGFIARHDSPLELGWVREFSRRAARRHFPPGVGQTLLDHYCRDHGEPLELTVAQMEEMEADINMMWTDPPNFNENFQRVVLSFVDSIVSEMRRIRTDLPDNDVFAHRTALWLGGPLIIFALVLYGAGIGLESIARGTLPLAVFGPERYPVIMGRIAMPSLIAQALAPTIGALLLKTGGPDGALVMSFTVAGGNAVLVVALLFILRFRPTETAGVA
jgi:hypothetical protein